MEFNRKKFARQFVILFCLSFGTSLILEILFDDWFIDLISRLILVAFLGWVTFFAIKILNFVEKIIKYDKHVSIPIYPPFMKLFIIIVFISVTIGQFSKPFAYDDYDIPMLVMIGVFLFGMITGMIPFSKPKDNEFRGKK